MQRRYLHAVETDLRSATSIAWPISSATFTVTVSPRRTNGSAIPCGSSVTRRTGKEEQQGDEEADFRLGLGTGVVSQNLLDYSIFHVANPPRFSQIASRFRLSGQLYRPQPLATCQVFVCLV